MLYHYPQSNRKHSIFPISHPAYFTHPSHWQLTITKVGCPPHSHNHHSTLSAHMTPAPTFASLIQRLHSLQCPFALDLTEPELCSAASQQRLHLIHFLLISLAPSLAPATLPSSTSPASVDALIASCVSLGVCDKSEAATVVCGASDVSWAPIGRVLSSLLDLCEARHSSLPSLDSAFDSQLSLLAAGCNSASSLLSTELHLFPADVLLTSKQLSQQQIGRALAAQIAQQTEALQSQLASLPAVATPSSSSSSALPVLLSSIAELSAALPAFHTFHSTHIAPLLLAFPCPSPASAPLASSLSSLSSDRSSALSQLQHAADTVCGMTAVVDVCGVCEAAGESGSVHVVSDVSESHSARLDVGRLSVVLQW